jgi:hypothetical protein
MNTPTGPFCQSCSMPLARPEDFGTDASGARVNDYCRYCFQRGSFTEPALTLDQMIDRLAQMSEKMHMTPAQARTMGLTFLPTLRRWREARTVATGVRH